MLTFSYTLFPTLKKEIENIDVIRVKILSELLSPQKEVKIRFETLAEKAASSLFLAGKSLSKEDILRIYETDKKNANARMANEFKSANNYIYRNWLLSEEKITDKAVLELVSFYSDAKFREKKDLRQMVEFITVNPEHGIIQAALAFFLLSRILNDDNNNIRLSSNISNLFLYKAGYDMRGMLNLDEYWANDLTTLKKILHDSAQVKNLSGFIEYYVSAVSIQAERALQKLREEKAKSADGALFFDLTTRQKKILNLFDKPGIKVTNRDVQKEFKISQITSSRDLAKLATLGLIFPNGRGRSVFYTKI